MSDFSRINDWEDLESLSHDELVIECAHQRWLMENMKAVLMIMAYDEGCDFQRWHPVVVTDEWARKILAYTAEHCPKSYGFDPVDLSDMGISYNLAEKHFEKYCKESGYYPPYEEDEEPCICGKTVWEKLDELPDDQLILRIVRTKRGIAEILRFIHGYEPDADVTSAWAEVPPEGWLRKIVAYLKKKGLDRNAIEDKLSDYGIDIVRPIYDDLSDYEPEDILDEIAGPENEKPKSETKPKHILGRPLVKITDYPSVDIPSDIAEMTP